MCGILWSFRNEKLFIIKKLFSGRSVFRTFCYFILAHCLVSLNLNSFNSWNLVKMILSKSHIKCIFEIACFQYIFISCIFLATKTATYAKHFGKYGEMTDYVIMKDKFTNQPRGFGFVTYANPSVVDKVIEDTHIINGKQVSARSFLIWLNIF